MTHLSFKSPGIITSTSSITSTTDTFNSLLTCPLKNMSEIRRLASHGVPDSLRGDVWKLLLDNCDTLHESDCSLKFLEKEYQCQVKENPDVSRRVRGEVFRLYQRSSSSSSVAVLNDASSILSTSPPMSGNSSTSPTTANGSFFTPSSTSSVQSAGFFQTFPVQQRKSALMRIASMEFPSIAERVIAAYLNHDPDIEFQYGFVYMVNALCSCLSNESDVFFCFYQIRKRIETWFDQSPFHERVSLFATQFRSQLPELYCLHIIRLLMQSEWVNRSSHFEEEELDIKECVTSWFKFLLARELPLPCLLRLWDTYLANGLDLHFYVCLAILHQCKDWLEELEQSEIRTVLQRIPELDIEEVLQQAELFKKQAECT